MARPPSGSVVERNGKRGRTYALRFTALGKRQFITLGTTVDGWSLSKAKTELENVLADVRRGTWQAPVGALTPTVADEPILHDLAADWVMRRAPEVDERTVEHWRWALSLHLLPFLGLYKPSEITVSTVKAYTTDKLEERKRRLAEVEKWRSADPATRGRMPARPLSNRSINATLTVLGQVLDEAIDQSFIQANVAQGKKRRLKAAKPKRTWLELVEVAALLDAAGKHRALLATMTLAGLRVGEVAELRWRHIDTAAGKLTVEDAKTDAGERVVDLSPDLLSELKLHRANSPDATADDLVFGTSNGNPQSRSNITKRILHPAVAKANAELVKAGRRPVEGVTNHTLRRTFASLLYETEATPAYVMSQMGHTDAKLALEVYAKVMSRPRDAGKKMDALIKGAVTAEVGTNDGDGTELVAERENKSPA